MMNELDHMCVQRPGDVGPSRQPIFYCDSYSERKGSPLTVPVRETSVELFRTLSEAIEDRAIVGSAVSNGLNSETVFGTNPWIEQRVCMKGLICQQNLSPTVPTFLATLSVRPFPYTTESDKRQA
jgi:hypothetical protein